MTFLGPVYFFVPGNVISMLWGKEVGVTGLIIVSYIWL